jgi:translation elongation factor EF-G
LLNKIDRLILELKMSVAEAAAALASIVTGLLGVLGFMVRSELPSQKSTRLRLVFI